MYEISVLIRIKVCSSIQIRSYPRFISGISMSLARRCSTSLESVSSLDSQGNFEVQPGRNFASPTEVANDAPVPIGKQHRIPPQFDVDFKLAF